MPNKFLNKWGVALVRVIGIAGFAYKSFSKWENEVWLELCIMAFFVAIALSPKRLVSLFSGRFSNSNNLKSTKEIPTDVGGGGTDEDGEV